MSGLLERLWRCDPYDTSCVDAAREAAAEVERLTAEVKHLQHSCDVYERQETQWAAEDAGLRQIIAEAPHGAGCTWFHGFSSTPRVCDCWKSKAEAKP